MQAASRRPRSRLAPEARESEILAGARAVLREVGYEKFQPAEVARRCGISEGLVYRYFPTRSDLLGRVAEDWLADVFANEPDLAAYTRTEDGLREVVDYGFRVIRAEPALTRYILLGLRAAPEFRGTAVHRLNRNITQLCIRVLESGVAKGEYRDDVPVAVVRDMIFGVIEHQTWAYLRGEGGFPPQQVAAGIASVIHHGMLARPRKG
ncbi:MAG TPA: TetR/AcrR family transcriptional regulator [Sporichthyaceae bacterium]|jgi:AcrR family transcriptional regulator